MVVCSSYVLKKCHNYIDQSNYCTNFKRASIFIEDVDKVDSIPFVFIVIDTFINNINNACSNYS